MLADKYSRNGSLLSLLSTPVEKTENAFLYSAIVQDLCTKQWNEPAVGRMEWLCFQLVNLVFEELTSCKTKCMKEIADVLQSEERIVTLDICWTTHKIRHDGFGMVSIACGANDRADFFLVTSSEQYPTNIVVLEIYHTTNAVESTYSGTDNVTIPETGTLAASRYNILGIVDTCIERLSQMHRTSIHLFPGTYEIELKPTQSRGDGSLARGEDQDAPQVTSHEEVHATRVFAEHWQEEEPDHGEGQVQFEADSDADSIQNDLRPKSVAGSDDDSIADFERGEKMV